MKNLAQKEREQKVINYYCCENKKITEISNILKVERKTIYRILKRNNIKLKVDEVVNEICECCGRKFTQRQSRNRKRCDTCNTAIRRIRLKRKCVEYKGGKCSKCGKISDDDSIFDFHHLDPTQKEFELKKADIAKMSWEIIKKELDKCILICSDCHRLEHSQYEKYKKYL